MSLFDVLAEPTRILAELEKRTDADLMLPADVEEKRARRVRAAAMLSVIAESGDRDPADVATAVIAAARLGDRKLQPMLRELSHLQRVIGNDDRVIAIADAVIAALAGAADELRANVGLSRLASSNVFGLLEVAPDGKARDANGAALRILALRRRSLPYLRVTGVFAEDETARRVLQAIDAQEALGPERGDVVTVDSGRATVDYAVVPTGDGATIFLYDVMRNAVRDPDAEATAFRARMLSILAHDLRTPLAAVLANAQRIAKQELPEVARESVERMLWSGDRMRRLLNDLVELASAGVGDGLPIARDEIDVGAVAASVIAELREEHPDRTIVFTADNNLRGRWDADRLAQAISNITRHALRQGATDADVDVAMTSTEQSVSVAVATRKRAQPVSGPSVGFYVAQQIVAAHGGLIEVQTRDGELRFTARLPRVTAAAARPA